MRLFILACIAFAIVDGSFINQMYPRVEYYRDGDDPGDPLYLTPLIESGDLQKARDLATVKHGSIPILNYAGYFTVNKTFNSNLFFWYFPAASNPTDAPVVLWLQGGPGASSLFGLFTENGPYSISKNKDGFLGLEPLEPRNYSWHENHHMIYIDNPVGTGFSFTDNDEGYARNERDVGQNLLTGLQQFFTLFPDLQKNDFFLTGESYGGKYVPAIGKAILDDSRRVSRDNTKPKINLKGLTIGNGLSDPLHQLNYGDYLYQLGLIDSNGRDQFVALQNKGAERIKAKDFRGAFDAFDQLINMDQYPQGSLFKNLTGFDVYFNYLKTVDDGDVPLGQFLQSTETRRAIHVGNNPFHDLGGAENKVELHLLEDICDSVADWVAELLSHYPVLIYNGQLDIIVAYPLTENYLKSLQFSGADEYKKAPRTIWRVDNEVAGYVKQAGNLTEVLVRNAGHMAPADQPKWVLDMITGFTHKKKFY